MAKAELLDENLTTIMTFRVPTSYKKRIQEKFVRGEFSKEMLAHLEKLLDEDQKRD